VVKSEIQSDAKWLAPPENLPPLANRVHAWLVRLDNERFCTACGDSLLGADEKDRASRFKFQRDRTRYIVSHAALRSILAAYLSVAAEELQFSLGAHGKPRLVSIQAKGIIQFNLSHSNNLALIVVAQGEIGVDVEWMKEDFPVMEVAQRFFTVKEIAALAALPIRLQSEAFYKCWTSKEAFLKAKGTGLSGELDEVEIVLTPENRVRIRGTVSNWSLYELNPSDGYAGALVVEGLGHEIKRYRWGGLTIDCPHQL
jgi:4'-phosphopantetheinyl transferase